MIFNLSRMVSPLGDLLMVVDQQGALRALDFDDHRPHLHRALREQYANYELVETPAPSHVADALERYFSGTLTALDEIVTMTAGNDFQHRVWQALREIPPGHTASYSDVAKELGLQDPRAAVDVGAANAANPIAIVVPCHRVIAKNGGLRGYAWGLHRKRWLLAHEGAMVAELAPPPGDMRLPGF